MTLRAAILNQLGEGGVELHVELLDRDHQRRHLTGDILGRERNRRLHHDALLDAQTSEFTLQTLQHVRHKGLAELTTLTLDLLRNRGHEIAELLRLPQLRIRILFATSLDVSDSLAHAAHQRRQEASEQLAQAAQGDVPRRLDLDKSDETTRTIEEVQYRTLTTSVAANLVHNRRD